MITWPKSFYKYAGYILAVETYKSIRAHNLVNVASLIFRSRSGSAASGQRIESENRVSVENIKMVSENMCFLNPGSSLDGQTPQQGHMVAKL